MESKLELGFFQKNYFVALTIFLAILMLGFYVVLASMIFRYGAYEKDFGWKYSSKEDFYVISEITPNNPTPNKLQVGDKILAINGDKSVQKNFDLLVTIVQAKQKIPPNSTYTIDIVRGSDIYQFELPTKLIVNYERLSITLSYFLCSLAFSISGFFIGILKPDQPLTRRLSIAMFVLSAFMLLNSTRFMIVFLQGFDYLCHLILWFSFPAMFPLAYDVYYSFPQNITKSKFWTFSKYFLYIFASLIAGISLWKNIYYLQDLSIENSILNNNTFLFARDISFDLLIIITLILLVSVTIRNYRLINKADDRRRIKWLVYASVIGFTPTLINNLTTLVLNSSEYRYIVSTSSYILFTRFGELFLTIIPLAFDYVIIRHKVFEIDFVIRQGMQYLFAKNFLRMILALEALGIIIVILLKPNLTLGEIFSLKSGYIYLISITVFSFVYRNNIALELDKKFFRVAYNREKILSNLLDEIKALSSITELSTKISEKLTEVLHPKSIYFFYRGQEKTDFTLGHSIDSNLIGNKIHTKPILANSELIHFMESEALAKELEVLTELPIEEKNWLINMQVQLIVPMVASSRETVGILLLGEKLSEEPYSKSDKKLLEAIASQLGVVYENKSLKEKVDKEEKIKQEVLVKLTEQKINLVKECPKCGKCFNNTDEVCSEDNSLLELTLPVEKVIDGKYELNKLLGKGGMGAVYSAKDLRLGRDVAIKVLKGSMFGDLEAMKRFEREAKASAKLTHPNIVAIFDYGKLNAEGAYLVMELVNGTTLKAKLNQYKTLAPDLVADLFDQILDAMKLAHSRGIIHRDLKPDNILITEVLGRNTIKILDFGIAKVKSTDRVDPNNANSLTVPGTIMGTFGYMPPEQFSGEEINECADIFALGVMIVEALTGSKPFAGKTIYELMGTMLSKAYHLPGTSPEVKLLDEKIQKCLAKEPQNRFQSISQMQVEIIPAIRSYREKTLSMPNSLSPSESDTVRLPKRK
ncbi:MAG: protein kinase [Acidobacteria bacterium]|nr:protein kinase [Acidobacteriota bacterium]